MPKFRVDWSKTYVLSGTEIINSDNAGDAEQEVWGNLGNLTDGNTFYDGNEDYVECSGEVLIDEDVVT